MDGILRFAQDDEWKAGRITRNAGSFLRKELPDRAEDRSERIDAPILRCLMAPPFLWKGTKYCGGAATFPPERKRTQPFYTTCGASRAPSRPLGAPSEPSAPFEPFEPFEPSRPKGVSIGDTTTLGPKARQTLEP